jgi:L-lactate dehydrogenase complex protein LldE
MNVGLFIPCYIDQFYPNVAVATLRLLEENDVRVSYPSWQTCCGQPMANAGFENYSKSCQSNFASNFSNFDYVVSPSGSCVLHLKNHLLHSDPDFAGRIFELSEFLTDIIREPVIKGHFPFKVGMHQSCHGQRGLHLSHMSERVAPPFSKPESLLKKVSGIQLIDLDRKDECCGFGGTFCITEETVSVKMGKDRLADHVKHGADYITSNDMSCLMHLEGILKRNKSAVKVVHIAEILNGSAR